MKYEGTNNPGFKSLPDFVQAKILANMEYGGMAYPFMQQGGEPDGAMALGQIDAAMEKLAKLRQFIQPDSDLEPWVSSKLTLMDDYAAAVADYMTHNPEAQGDEQMMMQQEEEPTEQMREGGIPQRYKNMGFTRVGQKKQGDGKHKWKVLAKKGDQYKVVQGGWRGMQDFKQHGSEKRRDRFWDRMGGRNSSKATDPFSPLYWHKKFGTWEEGGEINAPEMKNGGSTWSGNAWYGMGGYVPQYGMGGLPCYNCGGMYAEGGEQEMSPEPDPGYKYGKRTKVGSFLGKLGVKPLAEWTGANDSKVEDILEFIDPTGLSRWDDAAGKVRQYNKGKGSLLGTAAAIAGALPQASLFFPGRLLVSSLPKIGRALHHTKGIGNVANAWGMIEKMAHLNPNLFGPYNYSSPSLNYQEGGPVAGEEMEVTPDQLEDLRRRGYKFEII